MDAQALRQMRLRADEVDAQRQAERQELGAQHEAALAEERARRSEAVAGLQHELDAAREQVRALTGEQDGLAQARADVDAARVRDSVRLLRAQSAVSRRRLICSEDLCAPTASQFDAGRARAIACGDTLEVGRNGDACAHSQLCKRCAGGGGRRRTACSRRIGAVSK